MKAFYTHICKIVSILALTVFSLHCRGEINYGLVFRSYEATPAERTSLRIPSQDQESIEFIDSMRVSFSMMPNLNIGKFGYICRTMINGSESIDILLYTPENRRTYICATGDHENMIRIDLEKDRWHDLSLLLLREGDTVKARLNNIDVAQIAIKNIAPYAAICFGLNSEGYFKTNDVAPMAVKDLSIKVDRQAENSWKLKNGTEGAKANSLQARVSNPIWFKDLNSSWKKLWETELKSMSYIVPDNRNNLIYIVSAGEVIVYDILKMSSASYPTVHNIKAELITNDFLILPDGTLAYVDMENGKVIPFDRNTHEWTEDNPRTTHSIYLHSNTLYDRQSGDFVHLFGYGYHRYLSDIIIWNPADGRRKNLDVQGIQPRYMAAAGMHEGKIYVMSGKGNQQGDQALGATIYGDFLCIDPAKGECTRIWDGKDNHDEVGARDLIFEDNRGSFLAMTYNPSVYNTRLQLKRFHMDGSSESLGQSLPYNFLDIESEARLMYCRESQSYYAIIVQKDAGGRFNASIHSIMSPVQPAEAEVEDTGERILTWGHLTALLLVLLLIPGAWSILKTYRRRRGKAISPVHGTTSGSKDTVAVILPSAGIRLLGGFKVITREGQDISSSFSPLMKQLLAIIILNSTDGNGISNARLKDTLWFDKSDESYNNNRGVTLKKIRTCLAQVDESLGISSNKGRWILEDPKGLVDFMQAARILSGSSKSLEEILGVAGLGALLPDLRADWLDPYKGSYESRIISCLCSLRGEPADEKSAADAIRICDAILSFDDTDENSVRIKCQALILQKHMGTARKTFDQFCENYQRTLGEKFSENFSDFVRKTPR